MMNWDDLRLFLAVAREGSISGGARLLGIQHSTLSRRLHTLESDLGTRLIERRKTGYELTPAGKRLATAARLVEQEILTAEGALSDSDSHLCGELHVAAINNMASSILMPIFIDFHRAHPDIELHIQVSNEDTSLAYREADIALRLTNSPPETMIGKRLVTVASTIYGHRDTVARLNEGRDALPEWLGVECCGFHRTWTREACPAGKHGFYLDDTLLTRAALREGLGLAYLPCFMGDTDPELARYCDPETRHDLGLWLLFHPDLRQTARVLRFRDHMVEKIEPLKPLFEGRCPAQ